MLTPCLVESNIDEIIRIGCDIQGEYWGKPEFLMELPRKWKLSFVVENKDKKIIGYAISSLKDMHICHLHHFMVERNYRNKGIGGLMIKKVVDMAKDVSAKYLTLKVLAKNSKAISFYEAHGFVPLREDNDYILYRKKLV